MIYLPGCYFKCGLSCELRTIRPDAKRIRSAACVWRVQTTLRGTKREGTRYYTGKYELLKRRIRVPKKIGHELQQKERYGS